VDKGHAIIVSGRFTVNLMPDGFAKVPIDIGTIRYNR